jgi:trk system potassium uptake protein TrkH
MFLFGVNFSCYYLLLLRQFKGVFKDEELRLYIGIAAVSVVMIILNIRHLYGSLSETIRHAAFQVSSIMTTTGFATVDFNQWPEFSKHILLLLMVIGACAGSTGGGMKVSRVIILVKSLIAEVKQMISPKTIVTVRLEEKAVNKQVLNSTRIYAAAYLLLLCLFTLLLSLDGLDFESNFTAVLSCFNNIGPGLAAVGPMSNFSVYSDWAQVLLSVVMLTGRLEIFPMLLLFARSSHE